MSSTYKDREVPGNQLDNFSRMLLEECSIQHSVVGIRSRLECGVAMKASVMMGADDYQAEGERAAFLAEGRVPTEVNKVKPCGLEFEYFCRNCVIDKNARIGKNVIIANRDADRPSEGFYIRSGITVILKNSVIVDGTII